MNIVYNSSLIGILLGWCRCDGKTDHVFSPWGLHLHKWATRWCKPWCRLELELHPQAAPSIHQTCLFCMRLSRHVTAKFGYHGYFRTKVAFEFQMIYRMCSVQNCETTTHPPAIHQVLRGCPAAQSLTFIFNSERINAFAFWRKLVRKKGPTWKSVELLNQKKKPYQLGVPVLPIRAQ